MRTTIGASRATATFFLSSLLAFTGIAATPSVAEAACGYTGWTKNIRSVNPDGYPEVKFTSSVQYRYGVNCAGQATSIHIYTIHNSWTISENGWGLTREFKWMQARDGTTNDNIVVSYYINKKCSAESCTITADRTPNLEVPLDGRAQWFYLRSHCLCGLFRGGYIGVHWFVTGNISGYGCKC